MSNVSNNTVLLQVALNALQPPAPAARIALGHKCAGAFLHAAAHAALERRGVVFDEAAALWRAASSTPAGAATASPDRTAIKRLIDAVEAALAQLPAGTARLDYLPRAKTVGPWRLVCAPHVQWHVMGAPSPAAASAAGVDAIELPFMLTEPAQNAAQWAALLQIVNHFALAEDQLRRGQYADCVATWRTILTNSELSKAGHALAGLRLARALRRSGQFQQAQAALHQAALNARAIAGRAGDSLRAECALVSARLRFDVARTAALRELDFDQLWQATARSLSPSLQAQWANLNALVVRRQLLALTEGDAPLRERLPLHQRQLALYEAAIFWLLEDGDSYTLQAVVINVANYLNGIREWLALEGDACIAWMGTSLAAFALGHTLLDRFDLPQDSAWDFIMLGELYMGNPEVRASLRANPLNWPGQQSPSQEGFYRKSIEVAAACGDQRQLIVAWDQLGRWHKHFGEVQGVSEAADSVAALMANAPKLAQDLIKDGFRPVQAPDQPMPPASSDVEPASPEAGQNCSSP